MKTNLYSRSRLLLKLILIPMLMFTSTSHGNNVNYIIIDVRTIEEWRTGHLKDAKHLPLDILEDQVKNLVINPQETVYIYCRSGNRSGTAKQIMNRLGYQHAKNLGSLTEASQFLRQPIQK